ncbi:hypothetical protein QR680_016479 [Steinernema hermaphroditum]|uniref:Uncharacterized protein n=1 Tax=Steinernema hermaphroditum TaxID=289476 RepID=A0AA39LM19_9BILA|nr:hypothetical protein QR680_016479 [Steinernema hermaphroditum]
MVGDILNRIAYFASCFCITPIGLLFLYIVLQKSPSYIRSYRNNLLNITFWYYFDLLIYGLLFQPVVEFHGGRVCLKACGIGTILHPKAIYLLCSVFFVLTSNALMALWLCFLYRYAQVCSPKLANFLGTFYGYLFGSVVHIAASLGASLFAYPFVYMTKEVEVDAEPWICMEMQHNSVISAVLSTFAGALLFLTTSISTFTILTIRALRSERASLGKTTYRLQMLLTLNLVILAGIPTVCDALPVVAFCIAVYVESPKMPLISAVAAQTPFLDVLLSCVVTLIFVTPYRKAVCKLFSVKKTTATSSSGQAKLFSIVSNHPAAP